MTGELLRQSAFASGFDAGRARAEAEVQQLKEELAGRMEQLAECVEETQDLHETLSIVNMRAMRAVVEAARAAVGGSMGGYVALKETLARLDAAEKARTATPEGMQSEPPSPPPQPEQAT